ncbi:alpha/beta-hydrolase [Crepidotus variabilis]|uniref:Alpha/beta-hydrolase n=1 Tax=Crepidotus variabilis TaxID=179855 RepID=A0A9P6JR09_9AGAR|nr:alpha/beta-hydrolase [Crepidotus variabilis]
MFSAIGIFAFAVTFVSGAPTTVPLDLLKRSETAVSAADLKSLAPYTQFARAAYCPAGISTWNCGAACQANSDFQVTLAGGDGGSIQHYFVGYSPSLKSVIVSHEGTDPLELESDLTDINLLLGDLDSTLFPGVTDVVQAHTGFRDEHAKTAAIILKEVKRLFTAKGTKSVTLVGHSLGGAIAELDSLYLKLNLPSDSSIQAVTFGTPRVGNSAFAELIDTKVVKFKRVNNDHDLIPILPGRFLGYAHPEGEIHLEGPGKGFACSGNDDATDPDCTINVVPNVFSGNILDHLGPYEGIYIGTIYC